MFASGDAEAGLHKLSRKLVYRWSTGAKIHANFLHLVGSWGSALDHDGIPLKSSQNLGNWGNKKHECQCWCVYWLHMVLPWQPKNCTSTLICSVIICKNRASPDFAYTFNAKLIQRTKQVTTFCLHARIRIQTHLPDLAASSKSLSLTSALSSAIWASRLASNVFNLLLRDRSILLTGNLL